MFALVGSLGPVVVSASGGTPGALSFGQSPTAGNLLVGWAAVGGAATQPATPAGWANRGTGGAGTSCATAQFFKIAAGGDAAPSFASITSATQAFMLGEFSGNSLINPMDQGLAAAGTTSPLTVTRAVDATPGALTAYVCVEWYSAAATKTNTVALSHSTANDTNNNSTSAQLHYNFGWGVTTTNPSGETLTLTFTTTSITGAAVRNDSYRLSTVPSFSPRRMPQGV